MKRLMLIILAGLAVFSYTWATGDSATPSSRPLSTSRTTLFGGIRASDASLGALVTAHSLARAERVTVVMDGFPLLAVPDRVAVTLDYCFKDGRLSEMVLTTKDFVYSNKELAALRDAAAAIMHGADDVSHVGNSAIETTTAVFGEDGTKLYYTLEFWVEDRVPTVNVSVQVLTNIEALRSPTHSSSAESATRRALTCTWCAGFDGGAGGIGADHHRRHGNGSLLDQRPAVRV